jgi:tetratricopeptide (TPR) repeat protein
MIRTSVAALLSALIAQGTVAFAQSPAPLETWQELMANGSKSVQSNDFIAAEKYFSDALNVAATLDSSDTKFWPYFLLAQTLQDEGRYPQAEQAARNALAQPGGEMACDLLTLILSRQGKVDEAVEIQKKYALTKEERRAQVLLGTTLRARLFKDFLKQRAENGKGYVVVRFRVGLPDQKAPVCFISDSTAAPNYEQLALRHVQVADARGLNERLKHPYDCEFRYDYSYLAAREWKTMPGGIGVNYYRSGYTRPAYESIAYRQQRAKLALQEKELGVDHPECIATLATAAAKLTEAQQYDAAALAFSAVLGKLDATSSKDQFLRGFALSGLGNALVKQKKFEEALPVLEQAHSLKQKLLPPDAYLQVDPTELLANALTKLHRGAEAKALLSTLPKK